MYAHHHGYLHWDATLDPSVETWFRAFAAHGYDVASFVFDTNYLFKDLPGDARHLGDARRGVRMAAHEARHAVLSVRAQLGDPLTVRHRPRRPQELARCEDGGHRGHPIRLGLGARVDARRYRAAVERQSEVLVASFLEELETLGLREDTTFALLSDHGESWGERFVAKEDVKGVYHMHGATLFDEVVEVPLVLSAPGSIPTSSSRRCARSTSCRRCSSWPGSPRARRTKSLLQLDGDRDAIIAGTDMGAHEARRAQPPWKLILHVEGGEEAYRLDVDPRELHARDDVPPSCARSCSASSRAPSATS